MRNGHIILWE